VVVVLNPETAAPNVQTQVVASPVVQRRRYMAMCPVLAAEPPTLPTVVQPAGGVIAGTAAAVCRIARVTTTVSPVAGFVAKVTVADVGRVVTVWVWTPKARLR
jgi:hypothetical protein